MSEWVRLAGGPYDGRMLGRTGAMRIVAPGLDEEGYLVGDLHQWTFSHEADDGTWIYTYKELT